VSAAPWIPLERLDALPLVHRWNDDNPFRVIAHADDAVAARCERLSVRARLGFTLACAEWVLARFRRHHANERPARYAEALWAGLVDPAFAELRAEVLDDDTGAILGPIDLALGTATEAFRSHDPTDAAFASALARHVLGAGLELPPERASALRAFDEWQEACLARLERHHPVGTNRAVSREGFGIDLEAHEESRLVSRFLRRLDAAKNPFLVPTRH
jgi:hypothetical protein